MEPNEFRNPYAAPEAAIAPPPRRTPAHPREPKLSSRLARLLAALGDTLLVALALAPMVVAALTHERGQSISAAGAGLLLLTLVALAAVAALNLTLLYQRGQTLGKRWIGIRVVRSDGDRASLPRLLFLRGFVPGFIAAIPYLGNPFALVNVLWIFGQPRRCLHDYIADTIVVDA